MRRLRGTKTAKNSGRLLFFARQIARSPRISAELDRSLAVNFREKQRKTAKLQ
jgi:hypothetical protein